MKIAVTAHSFSTHDILRAELNAAFPGAVLNGSIPRPSQAQMAELIGDCDGAIVGLEKITAGLLAGCPRLKMISKYGVGLDNIDMAACRARGIEIGWTPGVNRLSVAELTLGFMLVLLRNIVPGCAGLKRGEWSKYRGAELSGKTIGVIGAGNIGQEVVRLLKPFGCRVLCNDIIDRSEFYAASGAEPAEKERIYAEADIVTLHVPLTGLTDGMVNREVLGKMRPSAFLINTARGGVVDKASLKWALGTGVIAGAALDVYPEEPETDLEFLNLPGLICTPHRAGSSDEAVLAMGRSAIAHLRRFFLR